MDEVPHEIIQEAMAKTMEGMGILQMLKPLLKRRNVLSPAEQEVFRSTLYQASRCLHEAHMLFYPPREIDPAAIAQGER
jgi:hypothetical protein